MPKLKSPPAEKPQSDLSSMTAMAYEISIPTDQISPSPYQTRQRFNEESLATLAESLSNHGQLQNLIVRKLDHESFELICGERRWRAGKLAELPAMRCLVIEADDDAARELVIIENLERDNVSAVEEAAGFAQLIDSGRYTQKSLAERLKRDPSYISNRLRLLKLPEEWREKIIDGSLPPTHARLLVPWAEHPEVLGEFSQRLTNILQGMELNETPGKLSDLSYDEFDETIRVCYHNKSRGMTPKHWDGPKFEVTDAIRDQLQVIEVRGRYNDETELRAFNIDLWDKLQQEAIAANADARKSSFDPAGFDGHDGADQDDDELQGNLTSRETSGLNDWKLDGAMAKHMQSVLAGHIKADAISLRLFLSVMVDDGYAFEQWLAADLGREDTPESPLQSLNLLSEITPKNLGAYAARFLQDSLADTERRSLIDLDVMLAICEQLKLDPVAHYSPTPDLLDLCSDAQLREILIDHIAPEKQVKKWKRPRMLKEAIENWPDGYLPILLKPKCMLASVETETPGSGDLMTLEEDESE